jgi:hypothetical protein
MYVSAAYVVDACRGISEQVHEETNDTNFEHAM